MDRTLFRLIINGNSDQTTSWHASSLGSYFFKDPTSKSTAFIYPDLNTAIVGNFEDNSVSQAYEAMITSTTMNEFGILQPQFEQTSKQFVKETANQETICQNPLIRDPYESKWVLVQDSKIPEAGQGLFALQDIKKGQLIAFFYGLPLQNMIQGSDYSIKFSDELLIDIPDNCRSTDIYCATLAHKICHSFEANAEYSYAFHPRFGRVIRCAVAIKDIESGTEITCNYKYKLQKAPEWYKRCLKTFLSVNLHCSEQDQQLIEKKLLHNNETILT